MKRALVLIGFFISLYFLSAQASFAAQYDLKKMTPEINQALANRQARYANLQRMKQSGAVGENNQGYVEALRGDPGAAAIVSAENADRQVIYRALVQQNALGPDGMRQVQKVFAEVQRDKSNAGEFIQSVSGDWAKKSL